VVSVLCGEGSFVIPPPHIIQCSGVFQFHAVSESAAQQLLSENDPTESTMGAVAKT